MGTRANWSGLDSMEAYLDSMVKVGVLMDERRYGLFAIPESTFRTMTEIDLAGLFTRVIPMEMRPMEYDLECGDQILVLECLGVSKLFKCLGEDEEVPVYDFEVFNMGRDNA